MLCLALLRLTMAASIDRSDPVPSVWSPEAGSPLFVRDAEYGGLDLSLQIPSCSFSRSETIDMTGSHCNLVIEPHRLVGRVTVDDLHSVHLLSV